MRTALTIALLFVHSSASGQCAGGSCSLPPRSLPPRYRESEKPHSASVRIVNSTQRSRSIGSGTLVARNQKTGLIVTAAHLFSDGVGTVVVTFPNRKSYGARVEAIDRKWDLAALVIARPESRPVTIANEAPRPDQAVWASGYGSRGQYQTHAGRVKGYRSPGDDLPYQLMAWTGPARDGDSGGPVLNAQGELAAVISSTEAVHRRYSMGAYCGRVKEFLSRWMGRYKRSPPLLPVTPNQTPTPPPVDPKKPGPSPGKPQWVEQFTSEIAALRQQVEKLRLMQGPPGKDGRDAKVDYKRLVDQLSIRPITVQILDEKGQVLQQQNVTLGGTLKFQLIPVNQLKQ